VQDREVFEIARRLASEEGIFGRMSAGAAVAGTLRFAEQAGSGTIVTIIPDRGDRYLSTNLFGSPCAERRAKDVCCL
jgi:cysteine synthase B